MIALLALVTAGCTSSDDGDGASDDPASAPSTPDDGDGGGGEPGDDLDGGAGPGPGDQIDPEVRGQLAALGGQLAVGAGPAVAVVRPDGGALTVLGDENENGAQPTWSRDGTALAWSSSSIDRQNLLVQRFDDEGRPDGDPTVSDASGFPVFYLQWSGNDERLGYLRSAEQPGQVEFGFAEPGQPLQPVAEDTPFFVAWSPQAGDNRLLAHVAQSRVELHDPAGVSGGAGGAPDPTVVVDQGADYSAPAWVDADRAMVVADGALSLVSVADGSIEPVAEVDGPVRFVVSPDGRRVAYRQLGSVDQGPQTAGLAASAETEPDGDGVIVVDLETGERQVVGDDTVAAWEWSPDGSRLAWLSVRATTRLLGTWRFWSADGSELVSDQTQEFSLTRKYGGVYLPFFAQYTQSITGWAPDSSAFAFAGTVDAEPGIWVQLLDTDAASVRVSAGDFVTWGPGPTPPDEGGVSAA